MTPIIEEFRARPSALSYMARAFRPRPGLLKAGGFPPLTIRWTGLRIRPDELRRCRDATGLSDAGRMTLLFPQVAGFRAQMALLTHPAFPLPIWRALQIRNRLVLHRPFAEGQSLDLETRVCAQRILARGAEVDLGTTLSRAGACVWEGLNTFYFRGRFGAEQPPSPQAAAPEFAGPAIGHWQTRSGGGWRFGRLTGDYNPLHWWTWYARRLGFSAAFHHPQCVIGQALGRLPAPAGDARRLDLWLKGPIPYGSTVTLRAETQPDGVRFALSTAGETRAGVIGHWHGALAPSSSGSCSAGPAAPRR